MNCQKITVITVVYNDCKGLEITANSIISQTSLSNVEWIVIDADSKDGTIDVVRKYKQHITHTISEPDNGIYDGMNKGIGLANGEYTIFMNSGDTFADKDVIKNTLEFISKNEADYISGNTYHTIDNRITGKHIAPSKISATFFFTDALCHQSTFIKTDRLKKYGGYDCKYKITADAKFFFEDIVLRNAKYQKIEIFVSRYGINGISACNPTRVQQEKMQFLSSLLPPLVKEDLQRVAFGKTNIERIFARLKHKGILYRIISIFAIILYSPRALKNRILMRFRKSNKNKTIIINPDETCNKGSLE